MKIVLITSCMAGIAHSKMAAAALKKEAAKRGHQICVEEQGGHKVPVKVTNEEIDDADIIIFAKMVSIAGKDRFKGKKILDVSVNKAVRKPLEIMDQAEKLFNVNSDD